MSTTVLEVTTNDSEDGGATVAVTLNTKAKDTDIVLGLIALIEMLAKRHHRSFDNTLKTIAEARMEMKKG